MHAHHTEKNPLVVDSQSPDNKRNMFGNAQIIQNLPLVGQAPEDILTSSMAISLYMLLPLTPSNTIYGNIDSQVI